MQLYLQKEDSVLSNSKSARQSNQVGPQILLPHNVSNEIIMKNERMKSSRDSHLVQTPLKKDQQFQPPQQSNPIRIKTLILEYQLL